MVFDCVSLIVTYFLYINNYLVNGNSFDVICDAIDDAGLWPSTCPNGNPLLTTCNCNQLDSNCQHCLGDNTGCSQCQQGYFYPYTSNQVCVACNNIDRCSFCNNNQGCAQCDNVNECTLITNSCGIKVCDCGNNVPSPTKSPTDQPTKSPTGTPTVSPTVSPTESPTVSPTLSPTAYPTAVPTQVPTSFPTAAPSTFTTQVRNIVTDFYLGIDCISIAELYVDDAKICVSGHEDLIELTDENGCFNVTNDVKFYCGTCDLGVEIFNQGSYTYPLDGKLHRVFEDYGCCMSSYVGLFNFHWVGSSIVRQNVSLFEQINVIYRQVEKTSNAFEHAYMRRTNTTLLYRE